MIFQASRKIAASPESVFAAFDDRDRLAIWWGPDGFTSTFRTFEFKPGGKWSFTMHGPDGKNYPNENVMMEIDRPGRIVIQHTSQPRYLLTITLEWTDDNETLVTWHQAFENPAVGKGMEEFLRQANEQLLNRLSAEVLNSNSF